MKYREHPPWLRVAGRLLVLGCLIAALLPPPVPWSRAALDLFVLVDESLSMPRNFNDSAWQELGPLLAAAPANSRLQLIRFAATPVLEDVIGTPRAAPASMPRSTALDRAATDIAGALQAALHRIEPAREAVVILVSDAAATGGDTEAALQAAQRANLPLYLMAPPAATSGAAARLTDLQVPARVNAGDQVTAVAQVESAGGAGAMLVVELDGQELGRRELQPRPGEPALAAFQFVAQSPGVTLVTARLAQDPAPITRDRQNTLTRAVNIQGQAPLLYVSQASGANPIVASLRLGGWELEVLTPPELMARLSVLQTVGGIILNNLAIADLSEAAWQAVEKSVREDGKGLAVLGGPRSFGAGAYRHSTLEQILPVTAEASEPQTPAAVLFLLDRSGSMGRDTTGPDRLAQARRAVAASIDLLLPDDYLGIITFAAEAETRLPLTTRRAASAQVLAALDVTPAGGTLLLPALQLAADQLRALELEQRMIVLVTDGFAADEDLHSVAAELRAGGITVIALAVGTEPGREALELLTGFNRGQVLAVEDAGSLPRLMTTTVAARRAPAVAEAAVPEPVRALPFPLDPVISWPPLSAYMVSKARPTAQVYLQSSRGDPLFATGTAGAGRVAVLPAGLGSWADTWWQWPQFGAFLGGLARWLDTGLGAQDLSLTVAQQAGELLISVDLNSSRARQTVEQPRLLVANPAGTRTELAPTLAAPGLYQATVPARQTGLYQTTLLAGGRSLQYAVYRNASEEWRSVARAPLRLHYWLEQGWLTPWPGSEGLWAATPRDASGVRRLMLTLALLSYLLLLAWERGLTRPLLPWLRARFSR